MAENGQNVDPFNREDTEVQELPRFDLQFINNQMLLNIGKSNYSQQDDWKLSLAILPSEEGAVHSFVWEFPIKEGQLASVERSLSTPI